MPLDGEEHPGAEHEHLERDEDYWDPIHHFDISRLLLDAIYREAHHLACEVKWRDLPSANERGKNASGDHTRLVVLHALRHIT